MTDDALTLEKLTAALPPVVPDWAVMIRDAESVEVCVTSSAPVGQMYILNSKAGSMFPELWQGAEISVICRPEDEAYAREVVRTLRGNHTAEGL